MKKMIPFISPVVCGLFGGLFIECTLCVCGIVVSPFSDTEEASFLAFLCITSFLLALLVIGMMIVNIVYLINQNNMQAIKRILIAQIVVGAVLFFVAWRFSKPVVEALYHLF